MLSRTVTIAAAFALALAACGGGSSGNGGGAAKRAGNGTTSTTAAPRAPSVAELRPQLLAIGDLPTGWASDSGDLSGDTGTGDGSGTGGPTSADASSTDDFLCPAGAARMPAALTSGDEDAEIAFSKGQLGPFLFQVAAGFPDAESLLRDADRALLTCEGQHWTTTDPTDGTKTTYTISRLAMPQHGDGQYAYRISGQAEGAMFSMDLVLVRVEHVVTLIAAMGVTTPMGGGQLDAAEFEHVVATAVHKLSAV